MRQSHLILSNALIIWASRVLLLVPQLVLVPYLISTIGETGYGVYALIWSLLMGIGQLEQSLQQGVVKYSAAFLAEKRIDQVNRVISSSFVFSLVLGILGAMGVCGIALTWQADGPDVASALLVVAGLMLLIIPLTPYLAVIQARQCYYVNAIAETLSKYLSLGIIFAWFTWIAPSVSALIIITAGMLFLSRFAQVSVAYRLIPGLYNRPTSFDRRIFRLIVAFGGTVVFLDLCNIANNTGIRWLMGLLVSMSFVAHLAIMLMPGGLMAQIVSAMTITIMPATSAYVATGNAHMLRELLIRSMRYTTIIVLAGFLVAIFLIEDVLILWVGKDYAFLAPYALAIFASVCLLMSTSTAHHMLKGLGRLRTTASIAVAGMVAVPLTLILLLHSLTGNPYISVTAGLVTGHAVWVILHIIFATKAVQSNFRETFIRVYGQPLLAATVAVLPVYALMHYGTIDGLPAHLGLTALSIGAFGAQMYYLYASQAERRQFCEIAEATLRHWRRFIKTRCDN